MEKFQNKYRIPSARTQWWDYRWAGGYFITICTQNRAHFFGEINNQQMRLSHIGVIADILWHQIPNHAKNIELGAFIVMPNHIHGILIIAPNENPNPNDVETGHALSLPHAPIISDATNMPHAPIIPPPEPPEPPKTIGQQRFQNIGKNSISSIVGSYKSAVTKHAHRLGFEFQWQTRFHDHIIRNDVAYQRINDYIETNPLHWDKDKFFKTQEQ